MSMASASPATSSTKETTNYARLCRLLVDVGTFALRDCFDATYTPRSLHTFLGASQPTLQSLRSSRIINAIQWGKLFPVVPSSVASTDFDITLLMILLRNICCLTPPVTGWDALPAATDFTREADIARVKYFRNTVYAHAEHASVDDATFDTRWKEIRDTLVRLGGVTYEVAIDKLEFCSMDPSTEYHYKELLDQWKNDEDNIRNELKEIGTDVKEVTTHVKEFGTVIKEVGTDVKEIGTDVKNLAKKLDDFVTSTVTPVREINDKGNGPEINEIMDASLVCREKFHEKELLASFCKQCKVCICRKCEQTRHSHHTTVDIDQAAEHHRVDIEDIVQEMRRKIADHKEQAERTKESFNRSGESIATARNKVMTSVEELIRFLREYEKTTITTLEIIEGKYQREHAAQQEHFEISMNQLQTQVEGCENVLKRKKSVEILQAHRALIGRCRGFLNAEKLNIYKPAHVGYKINEGLKENFRYAVEAVSGIIISSIDPLQSVAEGTGLQEGEVGREAKIKITTLDFDGNHCSSKGDQILVKVQSSLGKELSHKISSSKVGEFVVNYTPDCVGEHEVRIEVNGEPLTGSPWRVFVTPHRYRYCFSSEPSLIKNMLKRRGQIGCPCSIAIDDWSGNVAVAYYENRVMLYRFSLPCGKLCVEKLDTLKQLTKPTSVAFTNYSEIVVIASGKMFRLNWKKEFVKHVANKHLQKPQYLNIAHDGRMLVCDSDTVKVLSSDGAKLLLTINDPDGAISRCALCYQDMFFVSSQTGVKVFSKDGVFLYNIGNSETGEGPLKSPVGLAIDRFNNLVVCDCQKAKLQVFTLEGKYVNAIEGEDTGLSAPHSIVVSRSGRLWVSDVNKMCVHLFQ